MLFGPLRIGGSTKSNTLSSVSPRSGGLLAAGFKTCFFTSVFCHKNFLSPYVKNSEKVSYFVAFPLIKNHEVLDFVTQLVPTTSELILTGSTSYSGAVKL